jgi:nucleotidyltransferase/DNA polymerase involved in DNA repair
MTRSPHLSSATAACCWIPLYALRCEAERRPELATAPGVLLAPDHTHRVWQVSPLARHEGVKPGMTVGQAIGQCPTLLLCEPDPVYYDERFTALVASLARVSPVVEPVELGRVFVGMDGLEGLHGGPEGQIAMLGRTLGLDPSARSDPGRRAERSSMRLGWGRGKFVAWVAATRAKAGGALIVRVGEEERFLAAQPIAVLPLNPDTDRRLRQLGLKTLGALAALPEEAVVSQFGGAGRDVWRLAAGTVCDPVVGREAPEPIVVTITFFSPVAERDLLKHALGQLLERALKDPRRIGWRVQAVRVRAELEHGASWLVTTTLKDPTADRARLAAPLTVLLEQSPPTGAVERLAVELTAFAPGTQELQLFARDASAAARAGRRRALQSAAQEIKLRHRRSMLSHVIEVQPWSRLPERRYALIDFEP